jgi:inorganic pyrophosphatase
MNLSAVPLGGHPPNDVNVVIEVPIGGKPIKYEMHKESGAPTVDRSLNTPMRYSRELRLHRSHPVGRWRGEP